MQEKELTEKIAKAAEGLLMMSESDYPLDVFYQENSGQELLSPALVKRWLNKNEDEPVEMVKLGYFFRNMTVERPEHGEEEKEQARRFRELQDLLERELRNVVVYRIGQTQIDAVIVGMTPNDHFAGLHTRLIET